jgi:hypothetical protein
MQEILNLDCFNTNNDKVKEAILNVTQKNKKLSNFIKKVFKQNDDIEILAWEDYDWEWDIECYGSEGAEMAICNHYYRDDEHWDGDGWEIYQCPQIFANYFHNFNWEDIELDNGNYIFLIDKDDHWAFQIFNWDKLEDGKTFTHGITWTEQ